MKAMLVDENKNLVWSDVADPVIKDDEVLVKIHAAALNRADLLQREGKYPSPAGCPEWMGLEIAGEIVELGANVTNWQIGDKVCALLGGGGYAEYVAPPVVTTNGVYHLSGVMRTMDGSQRYVTPLVEIVVNLEDGSTQTLTPTNTPGGKK